ncbi:MAG TPA: hypothetical protein VGV35_17115 [Bryobacteraceae bacterium]|nr:hypothetical protein [Bryobacteraceae bacterium]
MSYRSIVLGSALALASVALLPAQTKSKNGSIPRTPDGKPDLQGVWTNATLTPLERPASFAGKATLSDAEATAYEKSVGDEFQKYDGKAVNPVADRFGSGGTGGYNALFVDQGSELARVDGVKRTSLIIDPPDGKVPPLTSEAKKRMSGMMQSFFNYDSAKTRPVSERCLVGFGSTSGPPMLPVLYNNNYQIVQTPNNVMILVEMVHDARIIRMNATHAPPTVRQWLGDSIGHWEGDTLVVDTTNFNDKTQFRGSVENLHVVERFQLVDRGTILYRVTIDDPTTFTKPWTAEYPFLATKGPVYEYACHEGNYAMTDILGGARKADKEKEKK